MWLSGLWRVIGGGDLVSTSMVLVIVADLFSEEERATALFRLSATVIVAEIVATPISAMMMSTDPWLPYLAGLSIILIFSPFLFLVPETIEEAREKTQKTLAAEAHDLLEELEPPSKGSLFATVCSGVQAFLQSTHFMWRNVNVVLTLLVLFVANLSKQSTNLLLQYASAKYQWSIARARFLISLRGSVSVATVLLLVPVISSLLIRYLHLDAARKDLYIAQASAAFAIAGYFVIFVAQTPPVLILGVVLMSLGIPFGMSLLSVATSLVLSDHIATLYSTVLVMNSVGMVVAGPIFASVYGFGLRLGLSWSGLPFGLASLIFVFASVAISCVRTGRPRSVAVAGD
ncbi:hypothetical protein VTN77DRAFT_3239 [Rasamsonia byssochlamydoides]|uniref:uncharacterized protein n=1 Tax=Rasamsonia byssochlamydoides TaxID=89139 RepID=UPI00374402A3